MNRNYNGLLVLFFVALLTSALFGGGPEPRIPVGSADIADDSVTNAKLAEPVSVANGGTGKTTAAESLAALGGASLNGSSTVAFNASTINGVAPLTSAEKTSALTGKTSLASGSSTVRESVAVLAAFGGGDVATLTTPLGLSSFMAGVLTTIDGNGNCAVYQLNGATTPSLLAGDNTANNPSTGTIQQIVAVGGGVFQLKRLGAAAGYAIKWVGLEY